MMFEATPDMMRRVAGAIASREPLATPARDLALLFAAIDILCSLGVPPGRWSLHPPHPERCGRAVDALLSELLVAADEIDQRPWIVSPAAARLAYEVRRLDREIVRLERMPRCWQLAGSW